MYALPYISGTNPVVKSQIRRTLINSLDILFTTFCANAVVLFSLLQDKGCKKSKFKFVRGSFDTKISTKFPNPSHRRGTVDDMSVELCDVGNLLNEVREVGSEESDTDINKLKSRACREGKEAEESRRPEIGNQASPLTSPNTSLCKREKCAVTNISQGKNQQALVRGNFGQDKNASREEIYCPGSNNANSNTTSFCAGEVDILSPAPVYLWDTKPT